MSEHYAKSGVNLQAGYESVKRIRSHIERTRRLGMMDNIGSFGGLFDLTRLNVSEPVLISGTDGVGTKLKIAFLTGKHDTIGIDAVAMCVNDILAQGAQPLFFLDYIAIGKNNPDTVEAIVKGVADGCVSANCALIGGETAEMPDMYSSDEYDIAGFCVGVAEKSKLILPSHVNVGDVIIGLASSGLHSNGFSLVRKILFKDHSLDPMMKFGEQTLGETLLTPTRIYVRAVLPLIQQCKIHGIAHITGGGFVENAPRCIQDEQGILIHKGTWPIPPIFTFLADLGRIPEDQLYQVFNMGIGMMLIVNPKDVEEVLEYLRSHHEHPYVIGEVTDTPGVVIR
jgi:phosphoribosylformylglycinamidine cyclo-ligase